MRKKLRLNHVKMCKLLRLFSGIPLVFLLIFTNIYQDPAGVFHDDSMEIANAILSGKAARSITGNANERAIKQIIIENMPNDINCVAVGPSLIMSIGKETVNEASFYNLGVSGADLYDVLAQFAIMEKNNKTPKRVLICFDTFLFDEEIYEAQSARNEDLISYTEYMLDLLEVERDATDNQTFQAVKYNINNLKTYLKQAFSPTYFQAAINQIVENQSFTLPSQRWMIVDSVLDEKHSFYSADGSWNYSISYRSNDVNYVREQCSNYSIEGYFAYDRHISQYSVNIIDKLIEYLAEKGVEVELFICPLPPSLWDRVESDRAHYYYLDEITDYALSLSDRMNIDIVGTFNPYEIGIMDDDYYDSRHIKRERIRDYFIFS